MSIKSLIIRGFVLLVLAACVVIGAWSLIMPKAGAMPMCNPYNTQNQGGGGAFGGFGEFCDEFPVASGQHFHCEFGGFIGYGGGCSWRWADNSIAPPPGR